MADRLGRAMLRGFGAMVRRELRGVWWRGEPPPGPFVWAANHHSWWDPFVAAALLARLGRTGSLLVQQENLDRYRFARRVGGFGTGEHRRGLAHLAAGRVLVIYPEGELRPAGPLGPLAGGAGWYAGRAGVPLWAAATRVLLRGHQAPEAYVWLLPVDRTDPDALGHRLGAGLADLDRLIAGTDPRAPLPGFARAVAGRRSWDERIDRLARLARLAGRAPRAGRR